MEIQNGDLKVVTGCDKTSAWGMACLGSGSSPRTQPTRETSDSYPSGSKGDRHVCLEFGPTKHNGYGRGGKYEWGHSLTAAEVKAGPDASEVAELRGTCRGEEEYTDYQNQCLFLRTMAPMLSPEAWQEILSEEEQESHSGDNENSLNQEEPDAYGRTDHSSRPSHSPDHTNQSNRSSRPSNGMEFSRKEIVVLDTSAMPSEFPSRLMPFVSFKRLFFFDFFCFFLYPLNW